MSDWRSHVGGMWDLVGQFQFDFMVQTGLMPEHRLLDVGCGALRGGVHFINYLNAGNYYGIEKEQWLVDAALEHELPRYHLDQKPLRIVVRDDFDVSGFNTLFDFAIAQSVFTHLTWNDILQCLLHVAPVLKPEGKFYATFFEVDADGMRVAPVERSAGIVTHLNRDPYHYSVDVLRDLARRSALTLTYIGDFNHPRGQHMVMFTRAAL